MDESSIGRDEYVRKVPGAYRRMPGTTGSVHPADRRLATQLHERGVSLVAVENALVLAAARRLLRPDHLPPLGMIRSLAYLLPVIDEVLELEVGPDYFRYVRSKIERFYSRPPTP